MAMVLVVDDSAFQRKKTCRMLERGGYQSCQAEDGQDALRVIEEECPDFIISDLNMPNMSGMELLTAMMEQEIGIPVLVVTSDVQDATREEAMEKGAAGVLNKPLNEDKLRITIEGFLGAQDGGMDELEGLA